MKLELIILLLSLLTKNLAIEIPNNESNCKNECGELTKTRIVIVKIGGSSITEKAQLETLNESALDWFSKSIKSAMMSSVNDRFIIVHGAGSFGHYHAKKYGFKGVSVPKEVVTKNEKRHAEVLNELHFSTKMGQGLSKTRLSVQKLHLALISSLIDNDINAVGLSPFSISPILDDFGLESLSTSITQSINHGMIPVIHGDAIFTKDNDLHVESKYSRDVEPSSSVGILGGDDIVLAIASHFAKEQNILSIEENRVCRKTQDQMEVSVVFITDVDGVFTSDPKLNDDAELVKLLYVSNDGIIQTSSQSDQDKNINASKSSHDHDVTGGLESKLRSAVTIASKGIKVAIVKCNSESAQGALRGQHFPIGTTIQLHSNFEECSI